MTYCTRADLEKRYSNKEVSDLLDRNNDGQDDAGAFAEREADAAGIINSYIATQYALPLPVVPALIKFAACSITRYLLWDDNRPQSVSEDYDETIKQLEQVRDDALKLTDNAGNILPPPATNTSGGVDYFAEERVFTRDSLSGFG